MRQLLLLVCVGVLLGGCAIGNTHRYDLGDAEFDLETKNSVAVTVVDLRPYILSGDKTPDFVGLQRGGFGNPFDVSTDSGRGLAEDMTGSIADALKTDGIRVVGVPVPAKSSAVDARRLLLLADTDRFALLTLREWKVDTYANTRLLFDMSLAVLDKDGTELATETLKGDDTLGSSFVPADARVYAETAVRNKLEMMFTAPEVKAALE